MPDEPSIGLHQRDNQKLIDTLHRLRDIRNTLVVVEHDEDMIRKADACETASETVKPWHRVLHRMYLSLHAVQSEAVYEDKKAFNPFSTC